MTEITEISKEHINVFCNCKQLALGSVRCSFYLCIKFRGQCRHGRFICVWWDVTSCGSSAFANVHLANDFNIAMISNMCDRCLSHPTCLFCFFPANIMAIFKSDQNLQNSGPTLISDTIVIQATDDHIYPSSWWIICLWSNWVCFLNTFISMETDHIWPQWSFTLYTF